VTRTVALLLDDPGNRYQALVAREGRAVAARHGIHLLEPEFAGGSSWTQVESVNRLLREARPDGVVMILAGEQWTRAPFERLLKAGVPVVLLNRIPDWVEDLRRDHPRALLGAVTPRQEGGRRYPGPAGRSDRRSGGVCPARHRDASSAAATARRRGFLGPSRAASSSTRSTDAGHPSAPRGRSRSGSGWAPIGIDPSASSCARTTRWRAGRGPPS